MEVIVKRYYWLVNALAVIVCAVLVAKGVNHLLESRFLADAERAPPPRPRPVDDPGMMNPTIRSKVGQPLAERNMFCSQCKPPAPPTPEGPAGTAVGGGGVPLTGLPLRLVATNVSTLEQFSFATIENTTSAKQGSYSVGSHIPDAGEVKKIRGKFVNFENSSSKRLERISLVTGAEPPPAPDPAVAYVPPPAPAYTPPGGDEVSQMIDAGVKQVSETAYDIDRGLVDKILENPAVVARGARIVPAIRNGKPNGFKLYAIRPGSIYSKIGLQNGDTIHSINGFELTTADKALEVYTKVREANNLTVQAERRGKPVTMTYSIK